MRTLLDTNSVLNVLYVHGLHPFKSNFVGVLTLSRHTQMSGDNTINTVTHACHNGMEKKKITKFRREKNVMQQKCCKVAVSEILPSVRVLSDLYYPAEYSHDSRCDIFHGAAHIPVKHVVARLSHIRPGEALKQYSSLSAESGMRGRVVSPGRLHDGEVKRDVRGVLEPVYLPVFPGELCS